jgi:adenylate cyclase class IV
MLMNNYRAACFVLKQPCVVRTLARSVAAKKIQLRMDSSHNNVALEVEQKFALHNETDVESRLMKLGFSKRGEIDMVDWYFDLPKPRWVLTPKDNWLRFRETDKTSSWQLKRGRQHKDGATVYEELEGEEAIEASISMLDNVDLVTMIPRVEFHGHVVPQLPRPTGLVPFARIETHRSSWSYPGKSDSFTGLVVDLDATQYGYMVGEIETVVHNDNDIALARERISSLIQKLSPQQNISLQIPVGKLEHFLIRYCPDHYEACVRGGSIPQQAKHSLND